METVSYTDARNHLKDIIEQVHTDHVPMRIERRKGAAAVIMSAEDYSGLQETLHLLGNAANADRLLQARNRGKKESIPIDEVLTELKH